MLLSCNRIRKQYDGIEILKGIDLDIAFGERIGLVGPNGAGKTTLMQAIAHEVSIDDGDITFWLPRTKIGYLRQSVGASRFSEGYRLITVTRRLESGKTIVEPPAADTDELRELLKISSQLGIGYLDEWSAQHINGLSGGERAKLALARIWSAQPDLLLLDEPTNHMDLNGIDWLIDQLRQYTGAVLVISHDRYFLDQVVCRIVEIDDGKAESYSGNYSFYREERARIRAAQLRQYEEAKRQEKRLEEDVLRTKQWAAKAHREAGKKSEIRSAKVGDRARAKRIDRQAKAKVKRLERHRARAPRKPKDDPNIRFQIKSAEKHGRRMIYAKGISKEYRAGPCLETVVSTSSEVTKSDCLAKTAAARQPSLKSSWEKKLLMRARSGSVHLRASDTSLREIRCQAQMDRRWMFSAYRVACSRQRQGPCSHRWVSERIWFISPSASSVRAKGPKWR